MGRQAEANTRPMEMWTIYARPADFPEVPFLVRGWLVLPNGALVPSGAVAFADTLEQARNVLPKGLMRFERDAEDEAQIVESWM